MEITVTGQTIKNFFVTVTDDTSTEEYDIASMLVIDESNMDQEIDAAAATEHFWAQAALTAEHTADTIENINYAQYAAHCERFARYYIRGLGEKTDTEKAKSKVAILLFSQMTSDARRQEFIEIAYKGHENEFTKVGLVPWSLKEFAEEMYSYPPFEEAEATVLAVRHHAKQIRTIASAFNQKSWTLKSKAATLRAARESNL